MHHFAGRRVSLGDGKLRHKKKIVAYIQERKLHPKLLLLGASNIIVCATLAELLLIISSHMLKRFITLNKNIFVHLVPFDFPL